MPCRTTWFRHVLHCARRDSDVTATLVAVRAWAARHRKTRDVAPNKPALWAEQYFDEMNDLVLVAEFSTGVILRANERGCRTRGMTPEELVGRTASEFIHPEDFGDIVNIMAGIADGGHRYVQRWKVLGEWVPFEIWSVIIGDDRALVCARDISVLTESLDRNDELLKLVTLADDILQVADDTGRVLYANPAAARLHGATVFNNESIYDFVYDDASRARVDQLVEEAIRDGRATGNITARRADGHPVELDVRTVWDADARRFYTVERDVTESRLAALELERLNSELSHAATHDALTGLANRVAIEEALTKMLSSDDVCALLLLDIDDFKTINETLGHESGDTLLQMVAARLTSLLAPGDVVARLGGDEFAILVRHRRETGAGQSGAEIAMAAAVQAQFREPFVVDGRRVHTSCSVGVAIADADTHSAIDLLREADTATYKAKASGRTGVEVFDEKLRQEVARRFELEAALRESLAKGALDIALQGIYDPKLREVRGYEALARWTDPKLGQVNPDEFIDVAERCGLLDDLSELVVQGSLERLAPQLREGLYLSVNFSPRQLRRPDFAEWISGLLQAHAVPQSSIVIEITEVGLTGDVYRALPTLGSLQGAGFQIAIDDFGKGATSLGYLRDIPLTGLKLDGSFVHQLESDATAHLIMSSTVKLASDLGLTVTAECVETEAQMALVTEMGCDRVQGYLLHHPAMVHDLET